MKKQKQKEEETLKTKKDEATATVSKLSSLLNEEKEKFLNDIKAINSFDQISKIEEILQQANQKNDERRNKLTPTSTTVIIPKEHKDRNYLRFEFKTTKATLDKIQNKNLKLLIEVVGKKGEQFVPEEYAPANYSTDTSKGLYVVPVANAEDGLIVVRIETHAYFNKATNAPEGKYKLIKLWDGDDMDKADLLNAPSQAVDISYNETATA